MLLKTMILQIVHCSRFETHQGSISSTYLRTAFTPVVPKSVRNQSSCLYLFTLLGSTGAKAARGTLMKLTPGVNFINILFATFSYESVLLQLFSSYRQFAFVIFWCKNIDAKAAHKMLMKLTTEYIENCHDCWVELFVYFMIRQYK